jgi:hypothetical protein
VLDVHGQNFLDLDGRRNTEVMTDDRVTHLVAENTRLEGIRGNIDRIEIINIKGTPAPETCIEETSVNTRELIIRVAYLDIRFKTVKMHVLNIGNLQKESIEHRREFPARKITRTPRLSRKDLIGRTDVELRHQARDIQSGHTVDSDVFALDLSIAAEAIVQGARGRHVRKKDHAHQK